MNYSKVLKFFRTDVERRNKLREYFSNTEAIYNEITDIIRKIIQK